MISFKDFLGDTKDGLFVALLPSEESLLKIEEYMTNNDIPNPVALDKIHMTVLCSEKPCPGFKPLGKFTPAYPSAAKKLELWLNRDGDPALVLNLKCKAAEGRHEELMNSLQATYAFPSYKTHVTLSYNVGSDFNVEDLPAFEHNIEWNREYSEPLNPTWT